LGNSVAAAALGEIGDKEAAGSLVTALIEKPIGEKTTEA
jgi:hypothetical protein